jgi:alkylglycerol monooxygenase
MISPIAYAVPVFIVSVAFEYWVGRRRGLTTFRAADTVSSLSLGIVSQIANSFSRAIGVGIYALIYEHAALFELPANALWVWIAGLILYDLAYYWNHRFGHTVAIMWASHVVHHSSEEYNLSTALRQSSTGFLFNWIFTAPLAVLGFPPLVIGIVALIDLLYQYWVHTQHVGKLGWLDRILVTPSNHRVHHGQNDYCLDRNYGGILILWDRLFGTFSEERDGEPIVYGIRGQLRSWNPLWANLHIYREIARDAWLTRNWADKLRVWFKHPGWRPADAAALAPKAPYEIRYFEPYAPSLQQPLARYAMTQVAVMLVFFTHYLVVVNTLDGVGKAAYASGIVLSLIALSRLTERGLTVAWLEWSRLTCMAAATVAAPWLGWQWSLPWLASLVGFAWSVRTARAAPVLAADKAAGAA